MKTQLATCPQAYLSFEQIIKNRPCECLYNGLCYMYNVTKYNLLKPFVDIDEIYYKNKLGSLLVYNAHWDEEEACATSGWWRGFIIFWRMHEHYVWLISLNK